MRPRHQLKLHRLACQFRCSSRQIGPLSVAPSLRGVPPRAQRREVVRLCSRAACICCMPTCLSQYTCRLTQQCVAYHNTLISNAAHRSLAVPVHFAHVLQLLRQRLCSPGSGSIRTTHCIRPQAAASSSAHHADQHLGFVFCVGLTHSSSRVHIPFLRTLSFQI